MGGGDAGAQQRRGERPGRPLRHLDGDLPRAGGPVARPAACTTTATCRHDQPPRPPASAPGRILAFVEAVRRTPHRERVRGAHERRGAHVDRPVTRPPSRPLATESSTRPRQSGRRPPGRGCAWPGSSRSDGPRRSRSPCASRPRRSACRWRSRRWPARRAQLIWAFQHQVGSPSGMSQAAEGHEQRCSARWAWGCRGTSRRRTVDGGGAEQVQVVPRRRILGIAREQQDVVARLDE